MTDKFIPFNPETAKNGDFVYGCYSKAEFVYIGPTPINGHSSFVIVYDVENEVYKAMPSNNLRLKAPKKTVWVNIYNGLNGDDVGYYYNTKEEAIKASSPKERSYIGTYPLEIDDVA